jgi:apolipoprotein N-acyltransferase
MAETSVLGRWQERLAAPIADLAAHLRALSSWQRFAAAAAAGGVSALAQAPFCVWPIIFLTLPTLVWWVDAAGAARRPWLAAGQIGWAFGFGYFLIGLHWIAFAFLVDVKAHLWLLPFAAVLMPAGLAFFFAVPTALARLAWPNDWRRIAILAASLSLFEWLRGHVLTGFPWNLFGYVWSGSDWMIQSASLFGIYALSLITIVAAVAPGALVRADGSRAPAKPLLILAVLAVLGLLAFGVWRLPSVAVAGVDGVALRIVQPNVPEAERWKDEFFLRNWHYLIDLTRSPGLETRTHVIWPEAAPPLLMLEQPEALKVVGDILPGRAVLLTGVVRREPAQPHSRFFNGMAVINGKGTVLATYDKAHLVPFGEYLPLESFLESLGITKITGGNGGYSVGPGVQTLTLPSGPPFGPLICYEIIFPAAVADPAARPQWLVNMTDDSWFGPWVGPYQHLGIARVRAVEEGLPVARAANTGVSAIIDPYGRIVASLDLNERGIIDGILPKALPVTFYGQFGDVLFFVFLLLTAIVGVIPRPVTR